MDVKKWGFFVSDDRMQKIFDPERTINKDELFSSAFGSRIIQV